MKNCFLIVVGVALFLVLRPARAQYQFVRSIGGPGSGAGQFNECWSVAVDHAGNVYGGSGDVDCRIEVFSPSGVFLNQFAAGPFPAGIAVDQSGNIFASAAEFGYFEKFSSNGTLLGQFGSCCTGPGQFEGPHGVALDLSGNVYVADEGNERIEEFTSSGSYLRQITPPFINGAGVWGVAVDRWGNVFATQGGRVVKFNSNGDYLGQVGSYGIGEGQYLDATGLAVDSLGNLFVSDSSGNRVEVYNSTGQYVTQFGSAGNANGQFSEAVSVAVDERGNVFVADAHNSRIEEFGLVPPSIAVPPSTQTAEFGSTVGFSVEVEPPEPGLTYHWFFNGTNALVSATNALLELTNVQPAQAGAYTVAVTNLPGEAVTSAPALLSVIPAVDRRIVPALDLTGGTGSLLHVEYADTLVAPQWSSVADVTLSGGPQYCFDSSQPLPAQRFYRAWQTNGPQPTLAASMATEIRLSRAGGSSVRVDYINQVGPTDAWVTLDTVTLTNTTQLYYDVTAFGQPARLYRLVTLP